jgi:outer membrane lipoprotein-sorting protein
MKKSILIIIIAIFYSEISFAQKPPSADEIIQKYLLITGNLKNVPSFSYQLSSGSNGHQGNRIKFKQPSKLFLAYVYEMEEMVRMCYNGKAYNEYYPVTRKSKVINQDKFCRELLSNMIFPELLIPSMKIKVTLEGTSDINQFKTQKVKFETSSGSKWLEYFEVNSGLKIRTSYEIKTDDGDMMLTTIDFQDYQDLGVFHLPQRLTLTMGALDMEYKVKNFKANESIDDEIFEEVK